MNKILIVNANYYKSISVDLIKSANNVLKKIHAKSNIVNVPGIFEIPATIRRHIKKYDGFIALGCVIKGETPHFDLISKSVFDGLIKISIDFNKPIGNGIITALTKTQAEKRSSLNKKKYKPNKGSEAAHAVISVLSNEPKKN